MGSPVLATDTDDDTPTYSLGGKDAASFDIDQATGQLQTKAPLDYETKDTYTVTVTATDSSNASGTVTVTINVTDVDEDGTVTLSSEYPRVDAALTATLNDPDAPAADIAWRWASATTAQGSYTDISGATSAAYTPVAGDVGNYLMVTVSYTDRFGSGKSARAETANAVWVNTVPAFPDMDSDTSGVQDAQTREVAENTAPGTDIGDPVAADDPDTGDTLTYSLGGTDATSFGITAATGQLQTKAALDYEAKSGYTVTVTATDSSNASGTVTVTINVTHV